MMGRRICASLAAFAFVVVGTDLASTPALADIKVWTPERASAAHTRSVLIWTVPEAGEPAVPRGFDDPAPGDKRSSQPSSSEGATDVPRPTKYPKAKRSKVFTVTTVTPSRYYRQVKRSLGQRYLGFKRQYRGQRYLGFRKSRRLNKYYVQKSKVYLRPAENDVVIVNEHPGPLMRRLDAVNTVPAYADLPDS